MSIPSSWQRWKHLLFDVRSEPNTVPVLNQATVVALYVVAILGTLVIPNNMVLDIAAGSWPSALGELIFVLVVWSGVVVFWVTRKLLWPRRIYSLAVLLICLQLVGDAGGPWGLGALYIVSGYSVLYFVLGLRSGVLIPFVLLIGTAIRLQLGHFHPLSIFNSADLTVRYLTILSVATLMGSVAVIYQNYLVRTLARAASEDPVTGLATKFRLEQYLAERLEQGQLFRQPFGLIAVKIQHFSQVNSVQGSSRADALLKKISQRMLVLAPREAVIGRYSGTIFLVVVPRAVSHDLKSLGQHLYRDVTQPYVVDGQTITLTCEVAVTVSPEDGDTAEGLFSNLLTTLHHSHGIPGQVLFFDRGQAEEDQHRFSLGEELRHAIERDEFHVVYHPKIDLATGRCSGAEVLLRWKNAKYGNVGPDQFIPLAEATGSIQQITRWVISTSFREMAGLDPGLVHAINLSPLDLSDASLLDFIDRELAANGLETSNIEFEITEGVLMDNDVTIQEVLEQLRNRGYRLAIDDFGTGYSSLSYLTRLRVNNLKIDQSFIRPLEDPSVAGTSAKHRIVEAVILMAKALNLDVTAEGVETAAQAEYLKATGGTYAQGWLYSKPVPIDQYAAWLEEHARTT